ncbi:MAG: hypothetical protein HQL66_07205, partial [Magnetococcales bacterium]|nr:hypothetical protein [Magnetococcales bacterium]
EEEPTITFTEQDGTENRQSLMEVVRAFLARQPIYYNRPVPGLLDSATAKLRAQLNARSTQLYQGALTRWTSPTFEESAQGQTEGTCKGHPGKKRASGDREQCCDASGRYTGCGSDRTDAEGREKHPRALTKDEIEKFVKCLEQFKGKNYDGPPPEDGEEEVEPTKGAASTPETGFDCSGSLNYALRCATGENVKYYRAGELQHSKNFFPVRDKGELTQDGKKRWDKLKRGDIIQMKTPYDHVAVVTDPKTGGILSVSTSEETMVETTMGGSFKDAVIQGVYEFVH